MYFELVHSHSELPYYCPTENLLKIKERFLTDIYDTANTANLVLLQINRLTRLQYHDYPE